MASEDKFHSISKDFYAEMFLLILDDFAVFYPKYFVGSEIFPTEMCYRWFFGKLPCLTLVVKTGKANHPPRSLQSEFLRSSLIYILNVKCDPANVMENDSVA